MQFKADWLCRFLCWFIPEVYYLTKLRLIILSDSNPFNPSDMKHICALMSLIFLSLLLTTCRKSKDKIASILPPITQEGKNTFGCKINGEVWAPYYPCQPFSNPCLEMSVAVGNTSATDPLPLYISLNLARQEDGKTSYFNIGFPVKGTGNVYDSLFLDFLSSTGISHKNNFETGKFEITKFDTINHIISGEFAFKLRSTLPDSIVVTDGRFDLKLGSVCKCSH